MRFGCPAIAFPKKCIRIDQKLAKMTMVLLPSFYRFLHNEKSETGLRRRIQFSVVAQSPIFHQMKIESVIHYKLKTTLMV